MQMLCSDRILVRFLAKSLLASANYWGSKSCSRFSLPVVCDRPSFAKGSSLQFQHHLPYRHVFKEKASTLLLMQESQKQRALYSSPRH